MTKHKIIPYGGWEHCLRLQNVSMEVVVTLDVGPRVIRCGFKDDRNFFVEYPDQLGRTGGSDYHSYGGHRLWVAPEEKPRTYYPDNVPVDWNEGGEWFHFRPPVETTTGLQKEMHLSLDPDRDRVRVLHRVTNRGPRSQSVAAWALSVMAPGGRAIMPHEPFRPHSEQLLPVRPLVFWAYTDMRDPRWTWGSRYLQLRQDPSLKHPQKIGGLNTLGWCAYLHGDQLFVKRFPFVREAQYPDFGCNCELFTNHRMLELESLGPLKTLGSGEFLTHEEMWFLFRNVKPGNGDEAAAETLEPVITQCT